jgi:hypothetical protein
MYRKIFQEAFRVVCASEAIEHTLLTLLATEWMRSLMQLEEHQPQIAHVVGCAILLAGDSLSRQPSCL